MNMLLWLVPISLGMGLVGLAAFMWSMKNAQFEDLDGAAERVLLHELDDAPLSDPSVSGGKERCEGNHEQTS